MPASQAKLGSIGFSHLVIEVGAIESYTFINLFSCYNLQEPKNEGMWQWDLMLSFVNCSMLLLILNLDFACSTDSGGLMYSFSFVLRYQLTKNLSELLLLIWLFGHSQTRPTFSSPPLTRSQRNSSNLHKIRRKSKVLRL